MVTRANSSAVSGDRFIDWMFKLTGDVREKTGLSEKKSAEVVGLIVECVRAEYGGRKPYVHSQLKSESILRHWRDGWTVQKIATNASCSEEYVRRVVSAGTGDEVRL